MGIAMILDLVAIFRARRDPRLAARLAARFAQDQAVERVTAPLFLVHILLWVVIGICALIIMGLAMAVLTLHWTFALLGLIPGLIGGLAVILEIGLRKGMARVHDMASQLTNRGMDRLIPHPQTGGDETGGEPSNDLPPSNSPQD